ncbi:MAG TPA: pitrilysin family protein [Pyrinomonadaceae bacterium]|nr:pitrilysin family protein [Pyrinomonadaceae bacterium]
MFYLKNFISVLLLSCLFGTSLPVKAQSARKSFVDFQETKLKNGLRVLTVEDHSAPVISLTISYNVGSRDERQGRTGFAHLFEHMMFKGSENVGAGEHFYQIYNSGGNMNGYTNPDRTIFFDNLPANQLDMALFLEADRMRSLAITKENLDNQRNAVQEEKRQNVDNVPYGASQVLQQNLLYDDFPYHHVTIGSMEDLNAATVEDVAQFFKTYYAPNNAFLVLVGDFDRKDALTRIRKNFEAIPRQSDPPPITMNEPLQASERRRTVEDPYARIPQIDIAFKSTSGNTPDFFAMEVLSTILQSGNSSRLYQRLVKEKELVTKIFGNMDERKGPGALYITATPRPGAKIEAVEAGIYEELGRLANEPVSDAELQKAKNIEQRNEYNQQTAFYRAFKLGIYSVQYNDPNLINTWQEKINAVTKDDIQRVARKYLGQNNRTVVITLPKAQSPTKPAGE